MKKVSLNFKENSGLEIARFLSRSALDKKAENLVILDVRGRSSFTDYFVIMSGRSTRHVQGIAETIGKELTRRRLKSSNAEGFKEGHWVLLDFNDVIVHIFYREVREFYDLEGLWHDAPRIEVESNSGTPEETENEEIG